MSHTKAEIKRLARETGTGRVVYPLETVDEVMRNEQLKHRQFFAEIDHGRAGKVKMPGPPFNLSETPCEMRMAAPLLGQDNVEVYCQRLGYSKKSLLQLRVSGII
jgi:crotonobetainyl-CoA:carnitine CoA-transferase CaiB-like acyl-CoA transferase